LTCVVCPKGFILDATLFTCSCPSSAPYLDKTNTCVPCNAPGHWDTNNLVCLICKNGQIFNQDTFSCVCPTTAPYVNKAGSCVSCNEPNFCFGIRGANGEIPPC
jgi:hypothetical protein